MADEPSPLDSILNRLQELERRIALLEEGTRPLPHPDHKRPHIHAGRPWSLPPLPDEADAGVHPAGPVESTSAARVAQALPETPPVESPEWNLEHLIGGKYYLAAGSLVVVIGVGLFLKLGYDAGWFRMADAWKCIWGALFGLALIGAGEAARRWINVLASSGLSAAGLGAIYLSTYAAHGFYHFISPLAAFGLLCVTVALGVVIASVARTVGVAVLAMLGGYLAPILLDLRGPTPLVLPLHTLALLGTGLILSGWKPATFRALRTLVWWGTVILGSFWMLDLGLDRPAMALSFLAIVWSAVHAELIASVRAQQPSEAHARGALLTWNKARPLATSFSTSIWCVSFGVLTLRSTPVLPEWWAPAGAMAAAGMLSGVLAGHLRVLRDSPRTDAQRLGAGLALQAGALLIAAVALAFSGSLEVSAWLAIGLAAVAAGAWVRAPSLSLYGLCILAIGAGRLVTYDAAVTRRFFVPIHAGPIAVDRWSLLMALGAVAWSAAALLFLREREELQPGEDAEASPWRAALLVIPDACASVGLVLAMASLLHTDTRPGALAIAWLAIGAAVSLARLIELRLALEAMGFGAIGAAVGAWVNAYVSRGWSSTSGGAILHPGIVVAALIILVLAALAIWYRRQDPVHHARRDLRPFWILSAGAAVALGWGATSLDIFRLAALFEAGRRGQHAAVSVWWGLFGVALIFAGFRYRVEVLRYFGLALLGIATAKALIIDLADVSPAWRVVSVLGLGLLMLGVALAYVRTSAHIAKIAPAGIGPETPS